MIPWALVLFTITGDEVELEDIISGLDIWLPPLLIGLLELEVEFPCTGLRVVLSTSQFLSAGPVNVASSSLLGCDEFTVLGSETRADDVLQESGSSVSPLCSGDPVSVSEDEDDIDKPFVE